jgi:uncharacterized membrane protein YcaP (DUF421 family)
MFRWFLGSWQTAGYVVLSTALIYVSVVAGLRFGERRTLSQMNVYDFAVATALGAVIGRTATAPAPSYAQGLAAVVTLLLAHNTLSWLRVTWAPVRRLTDRRPLALVHDGNVDTATLRRARLTTDDLGVILRKHGLDDISDAELVVLEPRGAFSVVRRDADATSPVPTKWGPTSAGTDDG